jgi:aminoglycoside phosphotransferase (APT) family kinase protein
VLNQYDRRQLTRAELDRVLAASGVDPAGLRAWVELTEGTYNTAYRIDLTGGDSLVLKVAPRPDLPALSHERDLLSTEAMFYRAAAACPVPLPRVVHDDNGRTVIDCDFLLMTACPGRGWYTQEDQLDPAQRTRLRTEFGGLIAALHQVTGSGFGYPRQATPLATTWRAAFLDMVDVVLADAVDYAVPLPLPPVEIAERVRAAGDVLAEVTTPVLVHFDLWDGNILLDLNSGTPVISGIIDAERAFWGDPAADFTSLDVFGDATTDVALMSGYQAAGGPVAFTESTRRRIALYRCYLYLIMFAEAAPRRFSGAEYEDRVTRLSPLLIENLTTAAG